MHETLTGIGDPLEQQHQDGIEAKNTLPWSMVAARSKPLSPAASPSSPCCSQGRMGAPGLLEGGARRRRWRAGNDDGRRRQWAWGRSRRLGRRSCGAESERRVCACLAGWGKKKSGAKVSFRVLVLTRIQDGAMRWHAT